MAKVASVTPIKSIQAEQQQTGQLTLWADQATVDKYVAEASDGVLTCRERGRHFFPSIRTAGVRFSGMDTRGRFVRQLLCEVCELVYRVEKWETFKVGRKLRYRKVNSTISYDVTGPKGETYLKEKGHGRMKPTQVQEALVDYAMAGLSLTMVKEQAMRGDR